MTNKEAYELIESCLNYDKAMSEYPERHEEAIRLAKEAFDKQEPVAIIEEWEEMTDDFIMRTFRCPNCQQVLDLEDS